MSAIWFQKTDIARLGGESVATDVEWPVSELPRIAATVLPGSGPISARIGCKSAKNGMVLADGALRGSLKLTCQRCLNEMTVDIDASLRLALSARETPTESIPEGYELLTIPGGEIRFMDLIEDELLLMLPIAAKHLDNECGASSDKQESLQDPAEPEMVTPFAGLAEMMRDRRN